MSIFQEVGRMNMSIFQEEAMHARARASCSQATNRLTYGARRGGTGYPLSCLQYRPRAVL